MLGLVREARAECCNNLFSSLRQNQVILLDTLDQEVAKLRECNATIDLNALVSFSRVFHGKRVVTLTADVFQFTEAKVYQSKLVNIRREMMVLHDKTSRLKVRASHHIHTLHTLSCLSQ
ncbi:hypothetical protein cypCar_00050521, partial [Cyprinus carpio]